jgi:hypothetical protein
MYFSGKTATMSTNITPMDRDVSKGCQQALCCGPGFWNIQFNSLLILNYGKQTKSIALVDDLLIATRAETIRQTANSQTQR